MAAPPLIVAVDLAHRSDHVADCALDLAHRLAARVVLVHAMQLPAGVQPSTIVQTPGHDPEPAADLLAADARKHTSALIERFRASGVPAELVLGYGALAPLLARTADARAAQMIVLGAPRPRALPRLWRQDVAAGVLSACGCPVVLVPRPGGRSQDSLSTGQFQMLAETDG